MQEASNNTTAGTFTLTFSGQTTAAIAFDASAANIESALEALSNIVDVTVTGSGTSGDPRVVTFVDPGSQNVVEMTADDTNMTGGTLTIMTTVEGGTGTITVSKFQIRLLDGNIVVVSGDTTSRASPNGGWATWPRSPIVVRSDLRAIVRPDNLIASLRDLLIVSSLHPCERSGSVGNSLQSRAPIAKDGVEGSNPFSLLQKSDKAHGSNLGAACDGLRKEEALRLDVSSQQPKRGIKT